MADCKRKTANLFDKTTITTGKWKSMSGDTTVSVGSYSDYIAVDSDTDYYATAIVSQPSFYSGVSYDSAKTPISNIELPRNITSGVIHTPANCAYIILNFSTNKANEVMLNKGSTAKPYEPYGWVHSLRKLGTSTDTLTTLPSTIIADGNSATVGLQGNMTQTGAPTPENPITPQETGDRTENLFDYKTVYSSYIDNNGNIATTANNLTQWNYFTADEIGKTFTISLYVDSISASYIRVQGQINESYITGNAINAGSTGFTEITVTPTSTSDRWRITYGTGTPNVVLNQVMVAVSSTRKEYEPYGYKIPISSGGTTTPVYLGEVQSTRQIKKLVLTGDESWRMGNYPKPDSYQFYIPKSVYFPDAKSTIANGESFCTHFISQDTTGGLAWGTNFNVYMPISDLPENATADDFKAYLAQQYANGTPVTVWYVLAEPTTGIINEPLRKIDDYADTVSGITIPTITGKDTFDVQTTLKASEVSLAYTGWHDAEVKEWDGSEWQ